VILILITVFGYCQPILAGDLGTLVPGPNNAKTITIDLISKHIPPETHYVQIMFANFENGNHIFLTTEDNQLLSSESIEVPVEKKETSYDLLLQSDFSASPDIYFFVLYTYTVKNGKFISESQQYHIYYFIISKWIILEETTPWYPPPTGESWEQAAIAQHTIKVAANDNWELSLKSLQNYPGLHAVSIEKEPEFPRPPLDLVVDCNLTKILEGSKTSTTETGDRVFTIILYFDDWTNLPAGQIDISLYLEAQIASMF